MAKKRANGEGNIRKRADGRWEGRYTAGYHSETGKRIIKNVLGKTQAECKAKLSAAMEATRGIDVSRADEYTVATWLRSWYEIYAKPNIRISTANRYQLMVEQYTIPRIGSIKLTKLTSRDLQRSDGKRSHRPQERSWQSRAQQHHGSESASHAAQCLGTGGQGTPDPTQSDRGLHRAESTKNRNADSSARAY